MTRTMRTEPRPFDRSRAAGGLDALRPSERALVRALVDAILRDLRSEAPITERRA